MRVVEGDTLEVVFRNTLDMETTLTPFGVIHSENDTEGVATNETKTYNWNITSDVSTFKCGTGSSETYDTNSSLRCQVRSFCGPILFSRLE